jgi:NAD(P)-dependent dehydrogenase (short-subunit alcohol dehydrogenase family)
MAPQPTTSHQLVGKRVAIIGGTSGIGFAAARSLIEEGAHVIVGSSNQSRVDEAIKRLNDSNEQYNADSSRVSGYTVNLSGKDMEASIRSFFKQAGKVDHIIHTAGDSLAMLPLHEVTYEKIITAGDVRFYSAILTAKIASEVLGPGSTLTLTTGSVAEHPIKDWAVVASYASGLHGMTRQLAFDFAPKRIRVNLISPGPVKTELWNFVPKEQQEGFFKQQGEKTLTGKMGEPAEVAQAYLYLLKDGNITGEVIRTDSGVKYAHPPSQ